MLVSQTDVLAQDLRRRDLLSHAQHDRAALDHSPPIDRLPITTAIVRQVVGAVLMRAGERLRTLVTPATATGVD